jgi:hypothetical protein
MTNILRLILIFFTLNFGFRESAMASEDIILYADFKSTILDLPNLACEVLLDSSINYRVTKIGSTLVIDALAQNTSGALLIVSCQGEIDREYSLQYRNQSIREDFTEDANPLSNRPDSYFESKISRSSKNETQWANTWVDRSVKELEVRAQKTNTLAGKKQSSESFDLAHHLGDSEFIYYGFTNFYAMTREAQGYHAGIGTSLISSGLDRTFYVSGRRSDNYYTSLSAPISIQLTGIDGGDGTWQRRASRTWFARSDNLTSRTTMSGVVQNDGRSLALEQNFSQFVGTLSTPVWLNNRSVGACASARKCKIREFAVGSSVKIGKLDGSWMHYLVPHFTLIGLEWKPNPRRILKLSFFRKFDTIPWTRQYKENEGDEIIAPDNQVAVDGDISLSFREGLFRSRIDYNQPILPERSRKFASVSTGIGHEDDSMDWEVVVTQRIVERKVAPSFIASIKAYTDHNLRRIELNLKKHGVHGKLISSITKKPIDGAKISLHQDGRKLLETATDAAGTYRFLNVPVSGRFHIEAKFEHNLVAKDFEKEISDSELEQNILMTDFFVVKVEFVLDTNSNGTIDSSDMHVILANEIPEIQDAIVKADGAIIATDQALYRRGDILTFELNEALLPNRYQLISLSPKTLDSVKESSAVVKVLLREKHD